MKWTKIDKDSYGTILTSWCICAVLIFLTARYTPIVWISAPLCAFMIIFMVFITWFFRVPDRVIPSPDRKNLVTSVADGKVVIVDKVYEKEYLKRDCIQISVYMDFFDVHCNFWPIMSIPLPASRMSTERCSSSRLPAPSPAASSATPRPVIWNTAESSAE